MNMQKNHHKIRISKKYIIVAASFIIGLSSSLLPLSAEAATTATSNANSNVSTPQKKLTLKERLQIRRALKKAEFQKKLAERKAKSAASTPSTTGFDEYQIPSLTQETYVTTPIPTKRSPPAETSIGTSFFTNIALDEAVPTRFFKDEIYILNGKIITPAKTEASTAFLNYKDITGKDHSLIFGADTKANAFSTPLYFTNEGSYSLGVIPGKSGTSKMQNIDVSMLEQKTENASTIDDSIDIMYDQTSDNSHIIWTKKEAGIYKITFEQGLEKVTYITRQNTSSLPIRYADFKKFKPGTMQVTASILPETLMGSWKIISSKTIPITYHGFRAVEKDMVNIIGTLPSIMTNLSPISIQGTALANLEKEAYVTNTQGLVESVTMQISHPLAGSTPSTVTIGSSFTLSYTPKTAGRYIVEINNEDGSAAINIPVYVATGAPLIPDILDISATMQIKEKPIDLTKDREYMLSLINDIRANLGKQKISLNPQLNALAQKHSDDMVARNFFGHVNPDGATSEDRRKKEGITVRTGENLSNSPSLLSGMQGLLRSPIHRSNIIDNEWASVGIGITQDKNNGGITIVQEFGAPALTTEGVSKIESDIISIINKSRNTLQISSLTEDASLSNIAKEWSDHLAKTDEFGFETKDGRSIYQLTEKTSTSSVIQIFIFSTDNIKNIDSRILEPSASLEAKWNKIGIGVSISPLGEIKVTTLLSK